ncbi:hypothetical protein M3J09_008348 [Ascochyta lentis]
MVSEKAYGAVRTVACQRYSVRLKCRVFCRVLDTFRTPEHSVAERISHPLTQARYTIGAHEESSKVAERESQGIERKADMYRQPEHAPSTPATSQQGAPLSKARDSESER